MNSFLTMKKGQVMLISIVTLGAAMFAATAIGGLLMNYQLRQAADVANSARAIFAADAGIERGLYQFFKVSNGSSYPAPNQVTLSNNAVSRLECFDSSFVLFPDCTDPSSVLIQSLGTMGRVSRSFEFRLQP